MNKIRLLLLVFFIMSLSGCTPKGCSFLPRASLLILSHHLEKVDEDTVQITGVARNDGATELQYAEVIGKFYDKQGGTLLHKGVAKTTDLGPGQIWEFTISMGVHPSLNILSWRLEIDGSGARITGEAENNGDVMLSFAKVTGRFYSAGGTEWASGTATTTGLGVGEIWKYTIPYPRSNYRKMHRAEVEVTDIDCEPIEGVDHTTVQVGTLRGRSVMP